MSYEINGLFIDLEDWIKIQTLAVKNNYNNWKMLRYIIKMGMEKILEDEKRNDIKKT